MREHGSKRPALKRTAFTQFDQKTWLPEIVARHTSFFVLLGVLLGQLLLLSIQVTRNQNVRLVNVWAAEVFGPFERGFHGAIESTVEAWASVHDLWAYKEANKQLGSDLVVARARIQQLTEKASEADRLKALLQFKEQSPYKTIAAQVIAASPQDGSTTVVIGRGKDAGIEVDMPVITPDGVVGKIAAVFAHTAQILLITDPTCGVGCLLEESRTQGVLKGSGRNQCGLHYVMDDQKVAVGEAVVTSGLDQVYPRGLLVGHVIRSEDGNIYRQITVKPAASLNRLESVLVLFKPASAQEEEVAQHQRR
ncbi:MAG: rod shape-determining protein MreC [Acidobacteria bacterium]|nr:MAG: rod shape-determining protein MreC [Acidobacteriota bacterium]